MDDNILDKINQILSTEQGREQLKNVASMLGASQEIENFLSGEASLDKAHQGNNQDGAKAPSEPRQPPPEKEANDDNPLISMLSDPKNMDIIMKLAPLIAKLNNKSNDINSQLILALKPHLRPENRHRADQAAQIMKLISVLPELRDSGIF